MPEARLPITVVVVARNEERRIAACLDSLAAQDRPGLDLEVIVVDNGSTDATRDIVRGFADVRLLEQPEPGIAPTRNLGLREARHDHVAFLDADCTAEPGWLAALERAMRGSGGAAGVGGPSLAPLETTVFRTAVDIAVRHFWGHHGSAQGQIHETPVPVDHLPTLNVLYDRRLVLAAGGFDAGMHNIGEDIELSHRLVREGRVLLFVPDAVVRHRWREDPWSWAKNMEVYGKGRTWLILKHPDAFRWRYLAPVLLLAVAVLALLGLRWPLLAAPLACYLVLTAIVSALSAGRTGRPALAPLVFLTYLLTHFAYGVGELHGLLPRRRRGEC